jgi:stearoyl-CoA desaturase (Delta-9 desaturase)
MNQLDPAPEESGAMATGAAAERRATERRATDNLRTMLEAEAGVVRGVVVSNPVARRLQRIAAFIIVVVPLVGTILAILQVFLYGVTWMEIGLLLGMYCVCITGATVGFHRHFTHRAFQARAPVRIVLAILGSMAAQGPLVYWVASHRRHHAYSDRPGDPHSPNLHGSGLRGLVHGLWHAHIGWMFAEEGSDWIHFARDVLGDRALFRIHEMYFTWVALGLAIPAALGGILTGTWSGVAAGFLWGGLVRMFLVNHASWCVGSVCHVFGSRPFDTKDFSANNYSVAVFTFGEGLQNNHHAFPSSAAHAVAWWEPDFAMIIIRVMQWLGLVWNVRLPTREAIEKARRRRPKSPAVLSAAVAASRDTTRSSQQDRSFL